MFSNKKSKRDVDPSTSENRINEGTVFVGDINSSGFFRIDGIVEGNIYSPSRIVIGKGGVIKGSLKCDNADIEGRVDGQMDISESLVLRATAVINGDIRTSQLAVEPGATFVGNCDMKGNVKTLQQEEQTKDIEQKKKRS